MAKIPFSIEHREKIESGEYKVETRDGRTARIICWDRKDNNYPIIALFEEYGKECLLSYTQNGQHVIGKSNVSDLFLVTPEPELTPLEDLLSTYLKNDFEYFSTKKWDEKKWNEVMRIQAAELLSLARKQLQPEIDAEIEKAYKTADEVQYKKGREDLLQELFKDSSTEELEKELKIFHDIFKNKDCSASAIRSWAQLFRTVAQKEYFVKTNLTASETIKEAIRTEYEKGRADVLKDLPRWKKCNSNTIYSTKCNLIVNGIGRYIILDGYMIDVDRLKKLPGFEEDE